VSRRNVEQGNFVQAGQALLALVTPEVWVTANFKESQLDHMRPGQRVDIAVDAYPSLRLTGHIDSIQLGSGSRFTAFPPENATGNYVKIVQRVPVKIAIDGGLPDGQRLPLGLSVTPVVRIR
jgi:membrane fusion protein (multidrug efflux system)